MITAIETIKSWFVKNARPTAQQFSDTWDSFWHKNDKLPVSDIPATNTALTKGYVRIAITPQGFIIGRDDYDGVYKMDYIVMDLLNSNGDIPNNFVLTIGDIEGGQYDIGMQKIGANFKIQYLLLRNYTNQDITIIEDREMHYAPDDITVPSGQAVEISFLYVEEVQALVITRSEALTWA
jgi:hypothetical protein